MEIVKKKNLKKKYYNFGYPVVKIDNFLEKKFCHNIILEMEKFNVFDDKVMVSRNRINKGSNNFKNFINNSVHSKKLYNKLNTYRCFLFMKRLLNLNNSNWRFFNSIKYFSKTNYGEQETTILTKIKKIFNRTRFVKTSLNLDIDFSIAERGYYRNIHRDRDNRVINFLLYFNNVESKSGGSFNIYSYNKNYFPRFPNKKFTKIKKKIFPKIGTLVIFLSSPNSYHEAGKFLSRKNEKRFFLYGSYCLNKKVLWFKN